METKQIIKQAIEREGISRYRLAKELGVKPSAVYHWESGRKKPNGTHLMELLKRAGKLAAGIVLGIALGGAIEPKETLEGEAQLKVKEARNTHYTQFKQWYQKKINKIKGILKNAALAIRWAISHGTGNT